VSCSEVLADAVFACVTSCSVARIVNYLIQMYILRGVCHRYVVALHAVDLIGTDTVVLYITVHFMFETPFEFQQCLKRVITVSVKNIRFIFYKTT